MAKFRKALLPLGLIAVAGIGAATWVLWPDTARLALADVMGTQPRITPPRSQTIPTVRVAKAVGWPDGAMPVAAPGLKVERYAAGLDHPRWLYRLPNGDMLVAETAAPPAAEDSKGFSIENMVMGVLMKRAGAAVPSANRITLLRDSDGDGRVDLKTPFITGLNSPFGMQLVGDWFYVANNDALVRFRYTAGATRIDGPAEKVVDLPAGGNHWTRNVIANPDGSGSLLVAVGSTSNIAEKGLEIERNRAAILEVFPDRKTFRIYAGGLRNPVGLAIEPASNAVWTVVNERDMLGSDLPPDYMARVGFGKFYGWPWSYWGGYEDRRVEPRRRDMLEYSARPDYALGPHTASLGLSFAADTRLGQRFANGAFVGQHGSWNRVPVSGYKVVFVPFGSNGYPVKGAKPVDVLSGFLDADGQAMGRPVGVIADATGALLVADDVGNVIWRVSAAGAPPKVAAR
ncbi:sorbosone dehydrogenase family protein [Sphingomonas sp. BGYR3]|uniref:PQQ-dependent sugar dehydrogenase n=1 Tax=Sphingomonas sp. BGYR3 TaxID=2975483 RepID=UPI0021A8A8EB|nr:sorbosone dehydrogenase family protein [Sphingomonas sp. BGYR3]MDG5489365.1 sorbosone dehydrogenase family protein [Sphingomonas sp. BGYR3]